MSGSRSMSGAPIGMLLFRADQASWSRLLWVDREGTELQVLGDEETWHSYPRISPDGQRISVSR